MGLETMFYTIGIIAMVLWVIIAITCLALVFYVRYQINAYKSSLAGKMASILQNKKTEVVTAIGLTAAQMILSRFRNGFGKKEKA